METSKGSPVREERLLILAIFAVLLLLPAEYGAAASRKPPWQDWKSEELAGHVLAGRVFAADQKVFLAPEDLADKLAINDHILLGEIHDNPDHHLLQAWLIDRIAHYDRHPVIVWEMIKLDQAAALADYLKDYRSPASKLGAAVGWEKSGWSAWSTYLPIALQAYRYRLAMIAGGARKSDVKMVGKNGLAALGNGEKERLAIERRLGWKLLNALNEELKTSHCNMLPDDMLETMQGVQRYRDAVMADQMLAAGRRSGAVLIAGSGHVRRDRGVPWYISGRDPDATIVSVMMIEVTEEAAFAEDLIPEDPWEKPAADYVWFTPRHKRPDPCKELKKHMAKKSAASEKVEAGESTPDGQKLGSGESKPDGKAKE